MSIVVHPILQACADVYALEGVMERYQAYTRLMLHPEVIPLGDFSPMGKRQAAYIHALLGMDAEAVAQKVANTISVVGAYRMLLVVVDQSGNGWTQRYSTDLDWRTGGPSRGLPQSSTNTWITVQLWTTPIEGWPFEVVSLQKYLEGQVLAAVARTLHQQQHGLPVTLDMLLKQEHAVFKASGEVCTLPKDELEYSYEVLQPLLGCGNYATILAAMYGDSAALSMGLKPLGLPVGAGFAVACVGCFDQLKVR